MGSDVRTGRIMAKFSKKYWEDQWKNGKTGWDIGYPAPALTMYFDQIEDKNLRILVPGAGNAYEVEYLWNHGFSNVYFNEIAEAPVLRFLDRVLDFPDKNILTKDFFRLQGQYDLIVEHTFFTAVHPEKRSQYVRKIHDLLKPGGKMAGLFFSHEFPYEGPPYGGTEEIYRTLFEPFFEIKVLEKAKNSIKPRDGRELFIVLKKQ